MFEVEMPVNTEPLDATNISTIILYFSEGEITEFKRLCKIGMAANYPDKNRANASDFLLKLLRQVYGKNNL